MYGPISWDVDPEIVTLFGSLSIRYYSLLFAAGLILGYWLVKKLSAREPDFYKKLDLLAFYIFLGTVLGARLGHCLFYEPEYFLKHPLEIFLPFKIIDGTFHFTGYQGLASHGGTLGVFLAILFFCRQTRTGLFFVLDKIAVAAPLTGAFIRLGNFMNSEIIGIPTGSDYGVIFQRVDSLPRHPAQLYEAFAYLLIFALLLYLHRRPTKAHADGFIFGLMLVLLFTARFVIEFYKIDQVAFEQGMWLNMGQLLSIPFVLIGIVIVLYKRRQVVK